MYTRKVDGLGCQFSQGEPQSFPPDHPGDDVSVETIPEGDVFDVLGFFAIVSVGKGEV